MGQYYKPLLIGKHGKYHILYSHDYDNGLKLMEHSYVGNTFVNAARSLLLNNPMCVAWVGDYSDDPYEDAYSKKLPYEKFMRFYKACWGEKTKHDRPHPMDYDEQNKGWKLVNHTAKCYVDMDEYNSNAVTWEKWNGKKIPVIVDPLPLLTACGNDRGGGDFHEGCVGYSNVGIWAFDMLEFTQTVPDGYEKVTFCFKE